MIPYECVESTIDFDVIGYRIRLWVNISEWEDFPDIVSIKDKIVHFVLGSNSVYKTPKQIVQFASTLENINAIQVIQEPNVAEPNQIGLMVYFVPFEKE